MSQSCTDYYIGRYPLKFFILVGSANLGTLYNLCFSSIIVLRIYIHNIVYIIRYASMFNLCFGFDLAWFGIWLGLEK